MTWFSELFAGKKPKVDDPVRRERYNVRKAMVTVTFRIDDASSVTTSKFKLIGHVYPKHEYAGNYRARIQWSVVDAKAEFEKWCETNARIGLVKLLLKDHEDETTGVLMVPLSSVHKIEAAFLDHHVHEDGSECSDEQAKKGSDDGK